MKTCILLLSCLACSLAQAQDRYRSYHRHIDRYFSLLTAYNGGKNHFGELGIAINEYGVNGRHPVAWAYFLSSEAKLNPRQQMVIAPKVGAWIGGGMAMGINMIYYYNLTSTAGSLRLRPEIGVGLDNFKLMYGYGFPLTNKRMEGISTHNVNLTILFGLKKLGAHRMISKENK